MKKRLLALLSVLVPAFLCWTSIQYQLAQKAEHANTRFAQLKDTCMKSTLDEKGTDLSNGQASSICGCLANEMDLASTGSMTPEKVQSVLSECSRKAGVSNRKSGSISAVAPIPM